MAVQVVFELFENLLNAIDALFIGDECFEMLGAQRDQKAQRCSFAGDPGLRIEFFKRAGRLLFPTPSQVVGQIPQWGDFLGQGRKEVEAKQWLHYAIFSHGLTKEALTKAGMSKTIAKKNRASRSRILANYFKGKAARSFLSSRANIAINFVKSYT